VLQSKINELESRNTELQRQLNLQHEAVGRDEPPREDGSLEQAYTRREHVHHLASEIKRLEPFENEVKKLQRQLKHMEEVHADVQKRDQQLCDQVALVSLKETVIEELRRQLSAASKCQQVSESKAGGLEIARLEEQLTGKEHEIARLKARLKKREKTKSVKEADDDSTSTPPPTAGDIAAMQAEYERKLEHKETMISRLKKRVTVLTEAAQQSGQGEGTTQDTSEEVEVRATSTAMASGGVSGDVLDDCYLEDSESVDKEVVEKLQRTVKERERKIKQLSDQLQSFMQTATDVEKIVKHSKDQSGEIARLKKQLEDAETEVYY
jgi:DNA repair exonuclease SbcCD ATPase subunit